MEKYSMSSLTSIDVYQARSEHFENADRLQQNRELETGQKFIRGRNFRAKNLINSKFNAIISKCRCWEREFTPRKLRNDHFSGITKKLYSLNVRLRLTEKSKNGIETKIVASNYS